MPRGRSSSQSPDRLVAQLAAAHRDGSRIRYDDALAPRDLTAAYAAQARVAEMLGAQVAGWKVGIRPDGTPMAAPIYAHLTKTSGASWAIPAKGALVVEVELALRLDDDLPAREQPYAREEVVEAVGEALIGIEFIHWRFATAEPPPFLALLADNLGNAGYVTGEATRDFRTLNLARRRCRMSLDAALAHDRLGGHPQDDPFAPLIACLGQGLMGLGGLRAGQFVTTGSLIAPLRPERRTVIRAEFDGIGSVVATVARPA
jgi:2-keto-4-pentenoate hydratase